MVEQIEKAKKELWFRTIWTTRWLMGMLVVLVVMFYWVANTNSTFKLAVYKMGLAIMASIVAHFVSKSLFPTISLSTLLLDVPNVEDETAHAIKFAGACVLRGSIMLGVILGVLLGI